jgi:hypothetical protein
MPKMVVLKRASDGRWEHLGATDVPGEQIALEVAQQIAVEQLAEGGGVYVPIPFELWRIFEAEAQITVKPVRMGAPPVRDDDEEPEDDAPLLRVEDDPDLVGLMQGPKRS